MSLINSLFYKLTARRDVTSARLKDFDVCIRLNPDSEIYRAHFPGMPITPGVCIIQIAVELLQDHLQHRLMLSKVKNAKFLKVIDPLQTPDLKYLFSKIKEDMDTASLSASVTVTDGVTVYSKLSLTFELK